MLSFDHLLYFSSGSLFLLSACVATEDIARSLRASRTEGHTVPLRLRTSVALALVAWLPLLLACGLVMR